MKKIMLLVFPILLLGCNSNEDKDQKQEAIKEVRVSNESNYVFKKIYIMDKLGRTHEILTATSGNTMGGVGMLELCVYDEDK